MEVRKRPDPVLSKKSKPVLGISDKEKELIQEMIKTMHFENGVGLAAPQVGHNIRIAVVNPDPENAKDMILINPEIISAKGSAAVEEGCLSLPGVYAKVKRAKEITVKMHDIHGKQLQFTAAGLLARIIQHEIDHLDGLLFADWLNVLKRRMLLRDYKKLQSKAIL